MPTGVQHPNPFEPGAIRSTLDLDVGELIVIAAAGDAARWPVVVRGGYRAPRSMIYLVVAALIVGLVVVVV